MTNEARQKKVENIKSGKLTKQQKDAMEILRGINKYMRMEPEIIILMQKKGWKLGNTYYDLFNAFVDVGLMDRTKISGKWAYKLKEN